MKRLLKKIRPEYLIHLLPLVSLMCALLKKQLGFYVAIYFTVFFLVVWLYVMLHKKVRRLMENRKLIRAVCLVTLFIGALQYNSGRVGNNKLKMFSGSCFIFSSVCFLIGDIVKSKK